MNRQNETSVVWFALVALVAAACSNEPSPLVDGGVTDARDGAIDGGPPPLELELIAGDIGGPGNLDGTGTAARFNAPLGVAVDAAGDVYVADTNNNTIRKVTAAGVVTTLAGRAGNASCADGTGAAAGFGLVSGLTVDGAGTVYVADGNCIRKITAAGVVTTLAGARGRIGHTDGIGSTEASFVSAAGVAVDGAGTVYVAESRVSSIRKITADGVVSSLRLIDPSGFSIWLQRTTGIAIDSAGNLYVSEASAIYKVDPTTGTTTFGTQQFSSDPGGVTFDGADNMYYTQLQSVYKVAADGGTDTLIGPDTGVGLFSPHGIAVDRAGTVYIADRSSNAIRKLSSTGVVGTLAGAVDRSGDADGAGSAASFRSPSGMDVDSAGNIYVADLNNQLIRKITPAGDVTTLAGDSHSVDSVDGTGAAAHFQAPSAVVLDGTGDAYIVEGVCIRKMTTTAGATTTLAGDCDTPSIDDGSHDDGIGAAARFSALGGGAVDRAGNLYVSDDSMVRKVTPDRVVTTLAGIRTMRGSADGTGAEARFGVAAGIVADRAGNLYVADWLNHTIRKITPDRVVTTLAGTAGMAGSTDGTGAAARFDRPGSLAIDSADNLYVADLGNSLIRKVSPTGVTTTVAGAAGGFGIVLGTSPRFGSPTLAVAGDSLVVSDANAILLLRYGAR